MPRRRSALTTSVVALCTCLSLTACSGLANSEASTGSPSSSSTSTPTTSSSTSTSPTEPTDTSTTPNPYLIDCTLVPQSLVDEWTKGGEPAVIEATENGCRVVSSDPTGAMIVEWRYLDVVNSSDDAGLVREVSKNSRAVTLAPGITAIRSETDVDPTRKARLYVTFDNGRTLYVAATATLDRPRTMTDLRRMTTKIVTTYAKLPGPSTTTEGATPSGTPDLPAPSATTG